MIKVVWIQILLLSRRFKVIFIQTLILLMILWWEIKGNENLTTCIPCMIFHGSMNKDNLFCKDCHGIHGIHAIESHVS